MKDPFIVRSSSFILQNEELMPSLVKFATIHDIPEGTMRAYEYGDLRIAIYHAGGTFYATSDICSHEYAELSEGYLDADDCTVECPLHGSRFDIRTGAALSLPAYEPIPIYAVQVEGEDVLVEVED
jgi:3-phenylpropionate/trans-cinnamate dioxygenase ferredoxin subunit